MEQEPKQPNPKQQELRDFLDNHPEIAEGARIGFQQIKEGKYRKVSLRPKT